MRVVVTLLMLALAAPAQKAAPQKAGSKTAADTLAPDAGGVSGREYHNAFFNFSYERGLNWRWLEDAELQKLRGEATEKAQTRLGEDAGGLASRRTYFLAVAMGTVPGTAVLITAEDLLMERELNSAAQYLDIVVANSGEFIPQGLTQPVTLAGLPFARRYFTQKQGDVPIYHAMTVTLQRRFAISFDCVAPSRERLDEALQTLESVRFAPPKK